MKKLLLAILIAFASNGIAQQKNQIVKYDSGYVNSFYNHRLEYFNAMPNNKNEIVFLGNSITEGGEWQELLPEYKNVINRGIGGDNSFGVLARLDEVISSKPKKIFFMIGTNDLARKIPLEIIIRNVQRMVDKTKTASPKTKIYIQSVLPVNGEKCATTSYRLNNPKAMELNKMYEKLCQKNNITFVNLYPLFLDSNGDLKAELTRDGIHPNGIVYTDWVKYLKEKKYL